MRVLLISDVHGNLVALEAVLQDARPFDVVWNLGDTVGYGPRPAECLTLLRTEVQTIALAGNHDLAAIGSLNLHEFNSLARQAAIWTGQRLSANDRERISRLVSTTVETGYSLAHGSPRSPVWEYILDAATATANLAFFSTQLCFVGHTHVPLVAEFGEACGRAVLSSFQAGTTIDLRRPRRIINPGSVGQPRDGDPRAAYAILDTARATIEARRVNYDIGKTQSQMASAGLPPALTRRLALGR